MIISLTSPLLIGLYEENNLIKKLSFDEQTSEVLPKIFTELFKEYHIQSVFFARGPGSFMAIKITYIFLRTLSIVKGIKLYANDGFYFSNNEPIKAMKKMYFIKENDTITSKFFKEEIHTNFFLPEKLNPEEFTEDIEPLYVLPAV